MFAPPAMEPGKSGACGKASTHFRQMEKRAAKRRRAEGEDQFLRYPESQARARAGKRPAARDGRGGRGLLCRQKDGLRAARLRFGRAGFRAIEARPASGCRGLRSNGKRRRRCLSDAVAICPFLKFPRAEDARPWRRGLRLCRRYRERVRRRWRWARVRARSAVWREPRESSRAEQARRS